MTTKKSATAPSASKPRIVTEVERFLRDQANWLEAEGYAKRADTARELATRLDANYDARELRKKPTKRRKAVKR